MARAFRFTKAAISHVVQGSPTSSQDEIDHRMSICRRCEYFTGATCLKCGCLVNSRAFLNKLAWRDQDCPIGRWEQEPRFWPALSESQLPDVVLVFPSGMSELWLETRGRQVVDLLNDNGIPAAMALVQETSVQQVAKVLELSRARVLINRAFIVDWQVIDELADRYRGTKFVSVNHSSHAYTQASDGWIRQQSETIRLAQERDNVLFGHVDERGIFSELGLANCLWFPNVVTESSSEPQEINVEDPLVSLTGRWQLIKNQLQQLMAIKLAGMRALVVMKNKERVASLFADSINLDHQVHRWGTWTEWNELISGRVAIGAQASFSESFNYVALEHMLQGRPVLGSSAIRYLPARWQADPDDVSDMARVLREIQADYRDNSLEARAIAEEVKKSNNEAALEVISGLIMRR